MSEREPTQPTTAPRGETKRPWGQSLRTALRVAFVENATLKLVALMLALTAFFLVHSDRRAVVSMTVRVSYSLPKGKVLASRPPDEVRITVRGSLRLIKRVDEREIERIHVVLPDTDAEFLFQNEMVRLPPGLELVSINPPSFPLRLEPPEERTVPVRIELTGSLPPGYEVTGRSLEPDKVLISGAESIVKATPYVATQPLSLDGRIATFVEDVPLVTSGELITFEDAVQTVLVKIEVGKKRTTKALPERQPVHVVLGPNVPPEAAATLTIEPAAAEVLLSGAELTLSAVDRVDLEVRVSAADLAETEPVELPVFVRQLPEGIASEIRPRVVRLIKKGGEQE